MNLAYVPDESRICAPRRSVLDLAATKSAGLERLLDDKYAIQLTHRLLRAASSAPTADDGEAEGGGEDGGDGGSAPQPPPGKAAAGMQTPGLSTTKVGGGHASSKDSILALWREVHAAAATVATAPGEKSEGERERDEGARGRERRMLARVRKGEGARQAASCLSAALG